MKSNIQNKIQKLLHKYKDGRGIRFSFRVVGCSFDEDFNLKLYSDETKMAEKGQTSPMYINCSNFNMLRIKYFPLFNISREFSPDFPCHSKA